MQTTKVVDRNGVFQSVTTTSGALFAPKTICSDCTAFLEITEKVSVACHHPADQIFGAYPAQNPEESWLITLRVGIVVPEELVGDPLSKDQLREIAAGQDLSIKGAYNLIETDWSQGYADFLNRGTVTYSRTDKEVREALGWL
jgi:hypothetical protein